MTGSGFDPGPPAALTRHFAAVPSYSEHRQKFWYDWGPVFYRGRLNRTARLIGIASDPGPTERVAARTLVGDAGQRVQGFLAKLGLTRSYVLVNAFAYALLPSWAMSATPMLAEPEHLEWRNRLLDLVSGSQVQAVVAFGVHAREAVRLWDSKPDVPVLEVPHPSSHDATALLDSWRDAVVTLRGVVTPDPDGDATGSNYQSSFREEDYARIPPSDLPFGLPAWVGDDAWGRAAHPRHNNSVERPEDDLLHTLVWVAPHDLP
jgi:hypothetical protein